MSRTESRTLVEQIRKATNERDGDMVVYISMAFGNPYEEPWGPEIVERGARLAEGGRCAPFPWRILRNATPGKEVGKLYTAVKDCVAESSSGVHLHSRPEGAAERVMAAYNAGCRRFDSALTGLGGCPFAGDELDRATSRPRRSCARWPEQPYGPASTSPR